MRRKGVGGLLLLLMLVAQGHSMAMRNTMAEPEAKPEMLYSDATPPCDGDIGESLMCWTCYHADTEEQCREGGYWQDCTDPMARCGVNYSYNDRGDIVGVEKGCVNFFECPRHQFSTGPDMCAESKTACSYCTYGERDLDFQCLNVSRLQEEKPRVYSSVPPCESSEMTDSRLSCWSCRNEKGDQACMENGHWELCHHEDSLCEYKSHTNQAKEVGQVFRQCIRNEDCPDYEKSQEDTCDKSLNGTVCKYCGYGVNKVEFDCVKPVCDGLENEGLLCWSCTNATSVGNCYDEGHWQACRRGNPRCEFEYVRDTSGEIVSVSRGCQELDNCTYYDDRPGEECTEENGATTCKNCTLGEVGLDHRCTNLTAVAPCATDEGQSLMCWTCFEQDGEDECRENGYWQACWQDEPWCEAEYLLDSDRHQSKLSRGCAERKACRSLAHGEPFCKDWGDRAYCRHCEFAAYAFDHLCLDASVLQAYSPRTYSFDWPCGLNNTEDQHGENLACFTCENQPDDATCLEKGKWEVCCHENPRCEYEVSMDGLGEVHNVSRRCQSFDECKNHELDHSDVCDKHAEDTTCKYCSFGVNNVEFQCTDNSTSCGGRLIGGKPGTGYIENPHLRTITTLVCPGYGDFVDCSVERYQANTCFEDGDCEGHGAKAKCCVNRCHMECVPLEELETATECIPFGAEGLHFMEGDEYEAHGFKCVCGKDGPYDCKPCEGGIEVNVFNGPVVINADTAVVHGPLPVVDEINLGLEAIAQAIEEAFENDDDIFKYRNVVEDENEGQQYVVEENPEKLPEGWESYPEWQKALWEQQTGQNWQEALAKEQVEADPSPHDDQPELPDFHELQEELEKLVEEGAVKSEAMAEGNEVNEGSENEEPIMLIEDKENALA